MPSKEWLMFGKPDEGHAIFSRKISESKSVAIATLQSASLRVLYKVHQPNISRDIVDSEICMFGEPLMTLSLN